MKNTYLITLLLIVTLSFLICFTGCTDNDPVPDTNDSSVASEESLEQTNNASDSEKALTTAIEASGLEHGDISDSSSKQIEGMTEVRFKSKSTGASYSYSYDKSGSLQKETVDYNRKPDKGSSALPDEDAVQLALDHAEVPFEDTTEFCCELKLINGENIYVIEFSTSSWSYEYEINASSREITSYSKIASSK